MDRFDAILREPVNLAAFPDTKLKELYKGLNIVLAQAEADTNKEDFAILGETLSPSRIFDVLCCPNDRRTCQLCIPSSPTF